MERARHRKSKSASGVDGIKQIQKQKTGSRLSMDSRAYVGGSTRNDMPFVLELGQCTSGRASGTPIKKLLACELAKEVEPKRRSPSIIAKLMGLEGLPSPSHIHRQQKRLSENYQPKNNAIKAQRNTLTYDGRSKSKNPKEQQEFKDVYEDLEASHVVNQHSSSRWSASPMHTKPEEVLNNQNLMDAKHFSANEKFQYLKEIDDTFGLLDSNKTMLVKFLDKPNSIFVKNLHDLQVDPSGPLHSHMAVLKPSDYGNYDSNTEAWTSVRDISTKNDICFHLKREDGLLLEPHSRHRTHISHKLSKVRPDKNNAKKILPTRIVVLKPNTGKVQNADAPLVPPDHSHDYLQYFKKINGHSSFNCTEPVLLRRKDSSYNMGSSKLMSNVAREKARKITRRMRDACDGTMDLMSSGFIGYAGDESSYDFFESESDSDSEMFKLLSRNSFDSRCRYLSSYSVDSHGKTKTKRKLSERGKMAYMYQDVEIVAKERPLSDMPAKCDRETRPKYSYAKMSLSSASKELGSNNGIAKWDGPLGISNRDCRKDETKKTSSRSRSLPPYIGGRIQRSTCHDLAAAKNPVHSDPVSDESRKVVRANQRLKEGITSRDIKSRSKKPLPWLHRSIGDLDSSLEANFEIQGEVKIERLYEKQPVFQTFLKDEICAIPESDAVKTAEHGTLVLPPNHSKLLPKLESSYVDNSAAFNQEDALFQEPHKSLSEQDCPTSQCQGTEPDSSESSKEADHFSPVSVLEVPFAEDTSHTESFERVGAELRDLRMQLQLLKMESGKYTEEEAVQESPMCSEGNDTLASDTWESSYISNVLIDSGIFEESGLDVFKTAWYTPECPLNPKLFDELEKTHCDNTTVLKCERKLLFDRMNSAILVIFQQHVDSCPWLMPKRLELHSNLQKEKLAQAFEKLIWQDFAEWQLSDRVLDQEIKWFDWKEEIDMIGNEIEALLVDDMILEVFM